MSDLFTRPSDAFVPQVLGDTIRNYAYAKSALYGTPAVYNIPNPIWNIGGNTVTFPLVSGFADTVRGTLNVDGLTGPEAGRFTITSETKDVNRTIVPVGMTGSSIIDALQNPDLMTELTTQIGLEVAKDTDIALLTEAATTSLTYDGTAGTISYASVVAAKAKFGDRIQESMVLVVHSKVYADLLSITESKTFQNYGPLNSGTVATGNVPYIAGMPVIVSDNVGVTTSGAYQITQSHYESYLVRVNALGYASQRDLSVRVVPQRNDRDVYEFIWTYVAHLRKENNKHMSCVLTTL